MNKPDIYTVDDIPYSSPYSDKEIKGYGYRIKMQGQLKLLINEIRFLTEDIEIHNMKDKEFTIVYIGSGKGFHIPFLIKLYEKYNINWVFFDPNGHCDKLYEFQKLSDKNITIRDELFLDNNIEEFRNVENLILISDIRSTQSTRDNLLDIDPKTQDLLNDYKIQNNFLKELKPMFSLLKFRLPFPDDWKDGYSFEKPIGKEYMQAFQKRASTEFRIFLNSVIVFTTIDSTEELIKYEEKFSWYNRHYRIPHQNDLDIAYYVFQNYYNIEVPSKQIKKKEILKFLNTIQYSY